MVSFTIPLRPVPKGRPRYGNGRTYTPQKTREYEEAVGMFARQYFTKPLESDLEVKMVFYVKGRHGDGDNLSKSIWDSLNGIAWIDDRQIVKWSGEIVKDSNERTEIVIDNAPL